MEALVAASKTEKSSTGAAMILRLNDYYILNSPKHVDLETVHRRIWICWV